MQLVFQFPIIDLRQVKKTGETVSVWPSADMSKAEVDALMKKSPFIRNFGKISNSPEGYFCNINCVNYTNISENGFTVNGSIAPIFNSYKRLYADSIYTTKAEFGFTDQLEAMITSGMSSGPVHITDILKHYMSIPLDVQDMGNIAGSIADAPDNSDNNAKNRITIKLGEISPILAANYCRSTVKNKEQPVADDYVINGEACLTLTYAANDNIKLPANAKKLDEFTVDSYTVQLMGINGILNNILLKYGCSRCLN